MKKWIQENITKYDIIHIHDIYNLPTYWAGKYAKENRIVVSVVYYRGSMFIIKYFILKNYENQVTDKW